MYALRLIAGKLFLERLYYETICAFMPLVRVVTKPVPYNIGRLPRDHAGRKANWVLSPGYDTHNVAVAKGDTAATFAGLEQAIPGKPVVFLSRYTSHREARQDYSNRNGSAHYWPHKVSR